LAISNERSLIMSGLIIFSILLSILSWVFLSRSIAKPVKGLEQAARAVGEGNLNVTLVHTSKDEFGQLTDTFRNMLTKIKDEIALSESLKKGFQIPFLIADKELNIAYYNEAAEAMFGYPASSVVNKMKVIEILGRDKGTRATLQGNPISEVRFETTDRSGNKIPVLASSGIIKDGSGQISAAFLLLNDLRKDKEKQEQYLKEQTSVISEALEKLAHGDLTAEVNIDKESPLYGLGRNLSSAINSLQDVLSRVTEAVQATASAANEISSSSEQRAAGSHEQSQQTSEVVGSVEQMTKTIMDSTQNAARASENSRLASSTAVEGTRKVEDTKKGMLKIVEATRTTGSRISSLTKKTEQIGEITQVIDDIADQTNLLALNAAIEAARAGEQGRGFAVVADEVRKLAERTTKATKEIAETIKAIQGEALEADSSMEEAGKAVEDGMRLTEDVALSLNKILEMNEKVLDIITQVAAASEEQSSAAEEISKNIEGISTVTQESAAGTEQIAKAAEDLNRLTVNLQDLISRFRLAGNDRAMSRR
ncbi:MAG: methyl-accepting chemotaxis protein, partial [Syntrophothermus sp.]